jgi:hypothetical protein
MCLLLDHGLRASEVADLQVTDLDLIWELLRFYRWKVAMSQTHRLTGDTVRATKQYVDASDAPAVGQLLRTTERPRSSELGETISIQGLRDRVQILGARVGVVGLSLHLRYQNIVDGSQTCGRLLPGCTLEEAQQCTKTYRRLSRTPKPCAPTFGASTTPKSVNVCRCAPSWPVAKHARIPR